MKVTYLKDKNCYVDGAGRLATVTDYGKDFYKCQHDFKDIGVRGKTPGANGKLVEASLHQCGKCLVYTVIEAKR